MEGIECYTCSVCKKIYDRKAKLQKHFHRSHSTKKYKCFDCGKMFILQSKLKVHSVCHSQFAEFLCSLCGKRFKRRDKLKEHINKIHSLAKEIKIEANVSKAPRTKRYRYQKGLEEQAGAFAYSCSVCGTGFNRRGILVNHVVRIHPELPLKSVPPLNKPVIKSRKAYKCHFCCKIYMSNGKRKLHILNHHPGHHLRNKQHLTESQDIADIEIIPKCCTLCPRQFLTNAKLLQHERKLHTWQKQEKCMLRLGPGSTTTGTATDSASLPAPVCQEDSLLRHGPGSTTTANLSASGTTTGTTSATVAAPVCPENPTHLHLV